MDFFSAAEKERIEKAVREVEKLTSGEIVPMVVDQSYHYPVAEILGAALFSLPPAALLSWWFGHESLWVFLVVFFAFYFPFKIAIRNIFWLKRFLIPPQEMAAEVEEKAQVSFLELGLHRTRDETGILILLSLFEKRVFVLADRGINRAVPEKTWEEIVGIVVEGIHRNRTCDALCQAIKRCGELLEKPLPRKKDDRDELPNLILE
ncbi:MAG: hypothetical protein JXB25_11540 [Deltaproteobacteria bacterium]|nr:hypothetical protein [Deltaproteobacteria bacterium]